MPQIQIIIASLGRAALLRETVDALADQTRTADGIVVAAVSPDDVAGLDQVRGNVRIVFSEKGSCRQRNRAIDLIEDDADIIVFFDDDFVPAPDYLARIEALFVEHPDMVGITGELLADGIHEGGFTFAQAQQIIAAPRPAPAPMRHRHELYGCNMAIRTSAARGMRFDENLPLYGWQEDIDFTNRLGRLGRQVSTGEVTGVHLGTRGGRTSGKRFGYSQIANILYLKRKGTMRAEAGNRLMFQNLTSNVLRSLRPEPHIDRRGRLLGNMLAIMDYARGRVDPRRIIEM